MLRAAEGGLKPLLDSPGARAAEPSHRKRAESSQDAIAEKRFRLLDDGVNSDSWEMSRQSSRQTVVTELLAQPTEQRGAKMVSTISHDNGVSQSTAAR